ncbi:MAG TPA: amidase [Solirubrobacteraceae bacterium]|nr:amidase [Solirubrobacteraceae bacterium]
MDSSEVAFAGVAGQVELMRRGDATSRELTQMSLDRIAALDRRLNAFNAVYRERALAEADDADRRRAAGERAPLLGVPMAIKDEVDIAGEVTSRGTGAVETAAVADSEVVRRLREAGAVIVGKTPMPELGLWPFTESVTWGVTRNPWDVERTPGGSSGGSGAAVAAGLVPAALAVDGAGSIRIPAACCGLFGLKPERDRVSRAPHDADEAHWICVGTLTRSVLDTAIVLDVMAGPGTGFEAAVRREPGRLRIAVSERFPAGVRGRLTGEVRAALDRTVDTLRSLGHEVVERDIPSRPEDVVTIVGLMLRGIHDFVEEVEQPQRLERRTRALARPGALISDSALEWLLARERAMTERVGTLFEDVDVLLTPMMSEPAKPAQAMEGRGAVATWLWETRWVPFNVIWNATGQPAASVPAGFSAGGLPLAVQLVGRHHDEATLLSLSAQLEAARPWAGRRPPVS